MEADSRSRDATHAVSDRTAARLLWTGGWDSTFRLLQLLVEHRVPVAPYYLEDPTRASTRTELETMERIGRCVRATWPHTRELLLPPRISRVTDVEVGADIADALEAVRRRSYIGSQYAWLPAFCKQHGIDDMELGVHVDDKVQALLRGFVAPFDHPAGYRSLRIDRRHEATAEYRLFRYFSFPLFAIDKVGIGHRAEAEGWGEVMAMTWFCHSPLRGSPCGICAPCLYTIEEGLAHRVPPSRRALSLLYRHCVLPLKPSLRRLRAWQRANRTAGNRGMSDLGDR